MTGKSKKVAQSFWEHSTESAENQLPKEESTKGGEKTLSAPWRGIRTYQRVSFLGTGLRHALSKKKIERCCQGYIAGRGRKEGFLP